MTQTARRLRPPLSVSHLALLVLLALTASTALGAVPAAAIEAPVSVAPGETAEEATTGSLCPTFHWTTVRGGRSIELVVYDLPSLQAGEGEPPAPTLRVTLPAGATGWTPPLDRCLEAGRRWAWAVRAIAADGPGPWSEARLFRTPLRPSDAEIRRAVELVGRYLGGEEGGPVAEEPAPAEEARAPAIGTDSGRAGSRSHGLREKVASASEAITTGSTGLRAKAPGTSGVTFGVEGVNASPDGAGVHGYTTDSDGLSGLFEGTLAAIGPATISLAPAIEATGRSFGPSVRAEHVNGPVGEVGHPAAGVRGVADHPSMFGVWGVNTAGGLAGYFEGAMEATGGLTLGGALSCDRCVDALDVADGSLTTDQIADGGIYGADIQTGSLDGSKILDGSLTGSDVANGSLTGADVQNGSLTKADQQDLAGVGWNEPPGGFQTIYPTSHAYLTAVRIDPPSSGVVTAIASGVITGQSSTRHTLPCEITSGSTVTDPHIEIHASDEDFVPFTIVRSFTVSGSEFRLALVCYGNGNVFKSFRESLTLLWTPQVLQVD